MFACTLCSQLTRSIQALPDVLEPLVSWLQTPVHAVHMLSPHHPTDKMMLVFESLPSGQATIVSLINKFEAKQLATAGVLLQCVTLMVAGEH